MIEIDFFNLLKEKIGGKVEFINANPLGITGADIDVAQRPKYENEDYNGNYIRLGFTEGQELTIELNRPPKFKLLIKPENFVSRTLNKVGLSFEIKINRKEFDEKYQIQEIDYDIAKNFFSDEVIEKIDSLYPFIEIVFTYKEYKLKKDIEFSENSIDDVIDGIDSLIALSKLAE